jgi:small subunit ribosomal protein S17
MKVFVGKVIGTKMAKTAVVSVERIVIHPLYKKRFKRDRKYQVHDELGVKINDMVRFTASKPYSRTKKWKVLEVVDSKVKKGGATGKK